MSFQVVSGQGYIQDNTITEAKLTFGVATYKGSTVSTGKGATISVGSLDLDTDKHYIVEFSIQAVDGTIAKPQLYYNADTTATNYYTIHNHTDDSGISCAKANENTICGYQITANSYLHGIIHIHKSKSGKTIAHTRAYTTTSTENNTAALLVNSTIMWSSTANITTIGLRDDGGDSYINTGSWIKVWKLPPTA